MILTLTTPAVNYIPVVCKSWVSGLIVMSIKSFTFSSFSLKVNHDTGLIAKCEFGDRFVHIIFNRNILLDYFRQRRKFLVKYVEDFHEIS